ncbi:MAG TPA: LPS export ABC transporter periplasmic protein LptC [Beijerinckiaceae bacterium]|nr:LPS export ABC transporter periplasmic protein LptC [Beijerinckiaceae bacterium]
MVSLAPFRLGLKSVRTAPEPQFGALSPTDQAFEAARRHSVRVRLLRKWIPIACFGAIALTAVGRFLNPFASLPQDVSVSSVALEGSRLTMEQPKLSGFKRDAKAYEVVADSAVQDIRKPNVVELNKPVARIEMQKGTWARLSAKTGVYDATGETLKVTDQVNIKTDTGLEMKLQRAEIAFKPGTMASDAPAEVVLPNGWVKSDRLSILDHGKVAVFEGNVKSEFIDNAPDAGTSTNDSGPKP